MRLVFAGTPEFARAALSRLHEAGHSIVLVFTQPDRPAGRGLQLQPSPVKAWAQAQQIPVAQPRSLRLDGRYPDDAVQAQQQLLEIQPDAIIVAAYGLLLPRWVLDVPRHGCLNIHASLLPRWRGAAPIHRAIEAGDAESGVTIMQMDEGLDTGAMLSMQSTPITTGETTGELHDRLATIGADLMVQALTEIEAGRACPQAQPQAGDPRICYAHKISKTEAQLHFNESAEVLARRICALNPAPGAQTQVGQDIVKLWRAQALSSPVLSANAQQPPGTVLAADAQGIDVACAQGVLRLTQLQKAGGKRLSAAEFLRGYAVHEGQCWGAAAS